MVHRQKIQKCHALFRAIHRLQNRLRFSDTWGWQFFSLNTNFVIIFWHKLWCWYCPYMININAWISSHVLHWAIIVDILLSDLFAFIQIWIGMLRCWAVPSVVNSNCFGLGAALGNWTYGCSLQLEIYCDSQKLIPDLILRQLKPGRKEFYSQWILLIRIAYQASARYWCTNKACLINILILTRVFHPG